MTVNQLRKELHLSQLELSIQSQVSPAMIVAIERYGYKPGPAVRSKIAAALGVKESLLWPDVQSNEVVTNGNN